MLVPPPIEPLAPGFIDANGLWVIKRKGDPVIKAQKRQINYSRKIPKPSVEFTQTQLCGPEESNDEGMYNVCLLENDNIPILLLHKSRNKNNVRFC